MTISGLQIYCLKTKLSEQSLIHNHDSVLFRIKKNVLFKNRCITVFPFEMFNDSFSVISFEFLSGVSDPPVYLSIYIYIQYIHVCFLFLQNEQCCCCCVVCFLFVWFLSGEVLSWISSSQSTLWVIIKIMLISQVKTWRQWDSVADPGHTDSKRNGDSSPDSAILKPTFLPTHWSPSSIACFTLLSVSFQMLLFLRRLISSFPNTDLCACSWQHVFTSGPLSWMFLLNPSSLGSKWHSAPGNSYISWSELTPEKNP